MIDIFLYAILPAIIGSIMATVIYYLRVPRQDILDAIRLIK